MHTVEKVSVPRREESFFVGFARGMERRGGGCLAAPGSASGRAGSTVCTALVPRKGERNPITERSGVERLMINRVMFN